MWLQCWEQSVLVAVQMQGDRSEANLITELWDHTTLHQENSRRDSMKWAEYLLKQVPAVFADEWMFTMKKGGYEAKYQDFWPKQIWQWIFY